MFKDSLTSLRKKSGLTQNELSARLRIAQSTLASYERGVREPSFEMMQRIADFFGVSVASMMLEPFEPPFFGGGPGGVPEKQKSPSPERDELTESIMELFDSLPESDRQKALGYLQALADSHK